MSFTERTVIVHWQVDDPLWESGDAEVMVHFDEQEKIICAYTYKKDAVSMPKGWVSKKQSKNPLFVDLTKTFISEHLDQLDVGEDE